MRNPFDSQRAEEEGWSEEVTTNFLGGIKTLCTECHGEGLIVHHIEIYDPYLEGVVPDTIEYICDTCEGHGMVPALPERYEGGEVVAL